MTESENTSQTGVKSNVLIVDDEAELLQMVQIALKRSGHKVWVSKDMDGARNLIQLNPIEIVLADLTIEKENDGLIILDELIPRAPDIAVVIMTGNHDVQTAITCLRNGAFDYLLKPFNLNELISVVNKVAERRYKMIEQRNRIEEQIIVLSRFPSESPSPVLRVKTDGTILYANMASLPLLKEWNCGMGQKVPEFLKNFIIETFKAERQQDIEVQSNGRIYSFTVTPIKDSDFVYVYGHDITRLKETERELTILKNQAQEMALHDPLTGLPNRILFEDRLEQAITQSLRGGTKTAIAFFDIDNFKQINDTYGHKVGDQLLIKIANYVKEATRRADTVARWGGDELILLLTGLHNQEEANFVCERIRRSVQEKLRDDDLGISATLSMGVAVCPDDAQTTELLEQQADTALYAAKRRGKNMVVLFSDTDYVNIFQQKARLGILLRQAIDNNKIVPYYQPIIETKTKRIVAIEALARWFETELGWVPPSTFILMAEEEGLIDSLGEKIATKAFNDFKILRQNNLQISLNLNVSLRQMYSIDYVEKLLQLTKNYHLEPEWITIEITESQALVGSIKRGNPLKEIASAGFRLSIDDFGQGYSSFSSLQEMPLNELKIDMSFVRNMKTEKGLRIVKAIVELAKILDLGTIGEGVEDKDEYEILSEIGVDKLQGYYIGQPMAFEEITNYLDTNLKILT